MLLTDMAQDFATREVCVAQRTLLPSLRHLSRSYIPTAATDRHIELYLDKNGFYVAEMTRMTLVNVVDVVVTRLV